MQYTEKGACQLLHYMLFADRLIDREDFIVMCTILSYAAEDQ